jgi:hypothetical protein
MNDKRLLFPKCLVILFFFGYFVFGLSLVDDYGIHWDDHSQYLNGLVTADYINEFCGGCLTDKSLSGIRLEDYSNKTHGVVFQEAALGVQYLLGITDARGIFLLRHYLTFIVFFIGLIFFYRILKSRYNNRALAMLGILFMILSPRIFADSFYNSKDIVFLSLTIISTWTLIRFLQSPTFSSATYHAVICALLISTRITGVFVPALTLFFLILKHFWLKEEMETEIQVKAAGFLAGLRFVLIKSGYYLFMMFLFTIVFWPYLWSDPLRHFMEIFTTMSHFNWDDPVLFRGMFLSPASLPFYYVPYWIAITTPVLYSFLFLAGLGFIVFLSRRDFSGLIDYVILAMFFFPLLAVILLGSVIYDGWRQLFFLYVPFLIISLKGLAGIFNFIDQKVRPDLVKWSKWSLYLIIFISCGSTAAFMVRNHPYQNVYFNFQAGMETTKDFEADYWGLSYRQVLQYLLDNDPSDTIKILSVNWPGKANADIFPKPQRDRLKFTSPGEAHYYISNYRFPTEHTMLMNLEYPYNQPVFEIKVRGNRIAGAYLLNR